MTQCNRLGRALAWSAFMLLAPAVGPTASAQGPIIIDHETRNLSAIPAAWINQAKATLHIAYGHTSHGSQLVTGMQGLYAWKGSLYAFNEGGSGGALDLQDTPFSGASDLGAPDRTAWATATRNYLSSHPQTNVVIWSWCGQVSSATAADINTYLSLMAALEHDYPHVKFVYMTGHLDGTGDTGNLHLRNNQIRNYCRTNNKILYDFADIESYDPDALVNYRPKLANDNCDYDNDGNGSRERNWALEWQASHVQNVDWYMCSAAHSQALNGNLKAYAAWWLWARLAGWSGPPAVVPDITVGDAARSEGGGSAVFGVSLSEATTTQVTVSYATADGTAQAGADYAAVSGQLSFAAGSTTRTISVPIHQDDVYDPDETFTVELSSASGGIITDGSGVGTIQDDDPMPQVAVEDCAVLEGDSGSTSCVVNLTLSGMSGATVTVDYATVAGSAAATVDFTPSSGTASFPPLSTGPTTIEVPVLGDTVVEMDESFLLDLSNASGAALPDAQATGTIVDDDAAALSSAELTHGSCVTAHLGGPSPDEDFFRLSQRPRSSYEVLVDGVTGDAVPLTVERLAADNTTVVGTASSVGAGPGLSLRWRNELPAQVDNQHVRIRAAGCAGGCSADDSYRVCLRETTASAPRFNNSATQRTVLLLQNPTSQAAEGSLFFWSAGGQLLHEHPFTLAAHALLTLGTASVPALYGRSGSVTLAHDGPYGGLTGKAVAVEPASGYSFDSPIGPRP